MPITAALAIANEGAEMAARKVDKNLVWGFGELPSNRIVDICTTMLGWWLYQSLRGR